MKARIASLAPGLAFIAFWIGALEVAARNGWVNRVFSPFPSEIAARLGGVLGSPALLEALGSTVGLLAAGFGLACAAGVLLGLAMGYHRPTYALLEPTLELLRPIPKPALLPPLILLLGLGAPMKVAIVFLGAFFPVLINTIEGVRTVDPVLVDVARTFRRGKLATVFRVILPASLPMILAGMRVSLGLGLILVTLAEMLTGTHGLGAQLVDAQRAFRVQDMYAWTVVLASLGLALALSFDALERRLIFWSSRR
ncbi:MAG TPA: ABC transporter permease [Burkholderiales bacterium]|jgi:ABC-type nitrate/sulfonate/bicarbonate transport system permease component|nr:ABC transporter permease [Burkholderiales bacterium]HEX2651292.1 ABC transporter permease [Burkholderiales bacterium]